MPVAAIREFLKLESAGGICLFFAAVVAIILDNSALAQLYDSFLTVPVAVQVDALEIAKPLLLWINDGLMAVFFFLVGLEIKREALEGQLLSVNQIALPGFAAVGGMAVPAANYAYFNWSNPVDINGWAIPLRATDSQGHSPLRHLEHILHPWVAFLVLRAFAFANAGVNFAGISFSTLLEPLPLGIALGLFVGKQIGVFGMAWLTIKTGLARMPEGANWSMIYGVSLLCGIGFTMSLFVGGLAFDDTGHAAAVRLGVLAGSITSGIAGYLVLKRAIARKA